MKRLVILLAAVLSAAGLVLAGIFIDYQNTARDLDLDTAAPRQYDRHYLFVSADRSRMLQDICGEISAACEASGACLEWCGKDAPGTYTVSECIDISIAMDADGIIVYPDGSPSVNDAIDRAKDAGIPVVTILRDLPGSGRVSYVGVSNYQMGELYGGWLLSLMQDGINDVCLLQDAGDSEGETQLLYTRMVQAVRNGAPGGEQMELRTRGVDSTLDFDAEEVIRDVLLEDTPDILICLNSVQTECAIQALIDYNLVGKVQVVGYYVTDTILSALRQDLIPVTMTIDTDSLGRDCVQALDEYLENGRTSSYYNITLDSMTPSTMRSKGEGRQETAAEEERV